MNELQTSINDYLNYCQTQKRLDEKTLKAYRIDLRQFSEQISVPKTPEIDSALIENHIAALHHKYQPKTVKRKIASLKAFFHFLEYKDLIEKNPFTASFRFHLTMNTLAVQLYTSHYLGVFGTYTR